MKSGRQAGNSTSVESHAFHGKLGRVRQLQMARPVALAVAAAVAAMTQWNRKLYIFDTLKICVFLHQVDFYLCSQKIAKFV